jgi:hypothetical protein
MTRRNWDRVRWEQKAVGAARANAALYRPSPGVVGGSGGRHVLPPIKLKQPVEQRPPYVVSILQPHEWLSPGLAGLREAVAEIRAEATPDFVAAWASSHVPTALADWSRAAAFRAAGLRNDTSGSVWCTFPSVFGTYGDSLGSSSSFATELLILSQLVVSERDWPESWTILTPALKAHGLAELKPPGALTWLEWKRKRSWSRSRH